MRAGQGLRRAPAGLLESGAARRPAGVLYPTQRPNFPFDLSMSCQDWAAASSDAKHTAVELYARRHGASPTSDDLDAVVSELDNVCVALASPSLANLSTTCHDWMALSSAQKTTNLVNYFSNQFTAHGVGFVTGQPIPRATLLPTDFVAGVVSSLDGACTGGLIFDVTVTMPRGTAPSDLAVTIDGQAMTRVRSNVGTPSGSSPMVLPKRFSPVRLGPGGDAATDTVTFHAANVSAGQHTVAVSGTGVIPSGQQVTVEVGQPASTTIQVQPQQAFIRVIVSGTLPQDLTILLDGQVMSGDGHGTYLFGPVSYGTHSVEVHGTGITVQQQNVTAAPGVTAEVAFALTQAPGSISVQVAAASGTLPSDVSVMVDGAPIAHASPDQPWQATSVPAGPHVIDVTATGYLPARQAINVAAGQAVTQQITLQPGSAQTGAAPASTASSAVTSAPMTRTQKVLVGVSILAGVAVVAGIIHTAVTEG